jgi:hypothetical protein
MVIRRDLLFAVAFGVTLGVLLIVPNLFLRNADWPRAIISAALLLCLWAGAWFLAPKLRADRKKSKTIDDQQDRPS